MTEHGIKFLQDIDFVAQDLDRDAHDLSELDNFIIAFRQEFVERRVESADGDG